MMSFFTAQAQSSNPSCCFWVENMQPVTAQHIANLDGTGIAQDTSAGMDLVLNNVLNRAIVGNTDVYTLHFPTGANCGSKVSIEWLLYRDGVLINDNLSRYVNSFGIYTKYETLNRDGLCEHVDWLGGNVANGDGICGCDANHQNHRDFPGASIATPLAPPYYDESHLAAGYTNTMYTYNFDYFYLPFLASDQSATEIHINWKQAGDYSLVIRVRERLGGVDYDFTYDGSQNPEMYIGGHQSCCGQILYQDSLHYLVTTAHEKSICDNDDPFMYGRGQRTATGSTLYAFSEESLYYVLFGDYVCDHWIVERIDTLQLYTRINPDIVARDTNLCRDENFTAADLLGLVTEVDLDAPGIIGHEIRWSENGVSWTTDMSQLLSLNQLTQTAGQYPFYARQFNFYYDAMDDDTIGCGGQVDTVVVNVRDLFPPILEGAHYYSYCNETLEANSPVVLRAHLDPQDFCSTEIRWYTEDDLGYPTHAAAYLKQIGDTISLDLTELNPENEDKVITFYLYTVNTNTNTFSAKYDSVTFEFFMTPEFVVDSTQLDFVVCPGASVTMNSMVSSIEPDYNDVLPTVTYEWFKNNVSLSNDTNLTVNASMVCNQVDTYTVHITAATIKGCQNEMTRTYTIKAQDIENPVMAWDTTGAAFDTLGNKIRTLSGCDSSAVPAPYTLDDFAVIADSTATVPATAVGTIIDGCVNVNTLNVTDVVTSHTACQTIVTRTYEAVDACGNHSNTISEIFTINNDFKPVISGRINVNPVRDTACTYDVPSYATLRNIFDNDTNIHVTYNCTESAFDTVVFYINNTNVLADGNLNIFADTNLVTIYAVVTDACGNSSAKTPVFDIHKPAAMYIAHGAITIDTLELCADVTTNMHFNDNFVMNADRPYTYQWSQISVVGQSIITPDSNNYLEAVIAPVDQMLNTSSHFIMTVTDSLGCVAADTSNAVHFYRLPTAEIISHPDNTGNPIHDGDTLCPNYGDFYVISGNSVSNLPDSVINYQSLGYTWSGASDVLNKHTNTNMFKMACENCDTLYTTYLTVTNMKNCSATTAFNIYGALRAEDTLTVTAITEKTMPLVSGRNDCVISVPDFVSTNVYFNPLTVQHNCFSLSEMEITQDVTPGTFVNHDTTVVITITAPRNQNNPDAVPCLTYTHVINVKMPANTVNITDIASSNVGCEPLATTLTPTVVNATGTCTWAWSTGATTETIDVTMTTAAHTYTLTVTDQAGCSSIMTVSPVVYRTPVRTDIEFVTTPNTYCDGAVDAMNNPIYDGTFTINVLNDTAEIAGYKWNGDNYTPYRPISYVYTGLVQNTYDFTVYTTHGCYATFTDTVKHDTTDLNAPFTATRLRDNFKCENPYEGSVQVTPNVENYVYQISSDTHFTDGEVITSDSTVITPIMFNWLYQDTYRVYVVSPKGCHFITNDVTVLDVTDTPTTHIVTIDTADCTMDNGILYIANSNPTYTYTVDGKTVRGNNGTLAFDSLSVGDHPITIVSSGNCSFVQPFTMPSRTAVPAIPTLTIHDNDYCEYMFGGYHGQNGSVTVPANQVMTGFTYTLAGETIIGVAGTAVVFDSLADQIYAMTIKDDHNCGINFNVEVGHSTLEFDTAKVTYTNGTDCANPDNKIQITNPNNAYNYFLARWYNNDWYINTDADNFADHNFIIDSLSDGYYMVVQEHKIFECYITLDSQYLHVVKPEYHITATHVDDQDCSYLGTGSITITNPNPNFTYSLNGVDSTVFTGLNGNGGVNYHVYAFNNVTNCNYDTVITVSLNSYTPQIATVTSTPNYNCITDKNGTVTVTLDSIVPGTYYIYYGSLEVANNTTGVFTGLNSNSYSVHFTSDLHCPSTTSLISVVDSAFIETEFVITPDFTCAPTLNMPGTGCIYVMEPHNNAQHNNYTYSLTLPGVWETNSIDIPSYKWCSLASATYTVVISDTVTGCVATNYVFVPDSTVHVTLDVVATDNNICTQGYGNGSITVTATADNLDAVLVYSIDGGTTWHNSGATINNLTSGNYEILVKDTWFNCLYDTCANKDVTINTVKKQLNVTFATVNNTACDPALYNGSITITGVKYNDGTDVDYSAALTNVDYSVVDYATTITNGWGHLNGIEYKVTITDNTTGCDTTISVTLTTENICSPSITVSAVNNNKHVGNDYYFCLGTVNAQLVAEASSACDPTFTYTWTRDCHPIISNTNTMDVWTGDVFSCTYTVTAVGDSSGCSSTMAVTVVVDPNPTIEFYATGANIQYLYANPTVTYTNCENYAFNFGIVNHSYDSVVWSNGHVDTNVYQFPVPTYQLTEGMTSYCVWVMDNNGCTANSVANVITRPVARYATSMEVCGSFHYVTQSGITIDSTYNAAVPYPFTVIDTFAAANACDSIVTYTVTIKANPTLNVAAAINALGQVVRCDGDVLPSTFAITTNHATASGYRITNNTEEQLTKTSFMTDTPFDPSAPLTRNMNGMNVYAYAYNACDTVYDVIGMLVVDSLPIVSGVTIAATPTYSTPYYCKDNIILNGDLSASATSYIGSVTSTNWILSSSQTDFSSAETITTARKAAMTDNGHYVNYAATNACGTSYGTPVQIHVDSVAAPELAVSPTTFCAGDVINMSNLTITPKATQTPGVTAYYYGGTTYSLGTQKLAYSATATAFQISIEYSCGTQLSNEVLITVKDTAHLDVPTTVDTICLQAGAYDFTVTTNPTNTVSASSNHTDIATVGATGNTVTVTPVGVGAVTITVTSTAADCGSKSKDVTFVIADTATNFGTVADVNACVGSTLSLTAPTYTPNGNVYSKGWLLDGAAFDPTTTPVQKADNGKTLTYFVTNICGTGHSNDAVLNVYDTAKLVISGSVDTLCVGNTFDYTIDTNLNNIVTITPSANITFTHTGATVTVTAVSTGDAKLIINCMGEHGCGEKKDSVEFVVSDLANVDHLATIAPVCEGEALTLAVPSYTDGNSNIHSEGWQVKKTSATSFSDFVASTAMTDDYKNAEIRYMVETYCGFAYSDTLTITVNDSAELTAPAEAVQTVCNNTAITDIVMTTNKPLAISSELSGAGLSVSGNTISGTVSIASTETFPYTLTGTVSTVSTDCPAYDKTETITITVNEAPTATLSVPNDTLCADGATAINPTLTVTQNHSTETATETYYMKKKADDTFSTFTITTPVTADMDSALVYCNVANTCGDNNSDTVVVRVAGTLTVDITPVTFRDTCEGLPLSDFIVSGTPTVTPQTTATLIDSAFWFKKDGSNYVKLTLDSIMTDPTTIVYGAYTKCSADPVYSTDIVLGFDHAPTFVNATPFTIAAICEGEQFNGGVEPTVDVNANGGVVTKTWTINGDALDFDAIYDAATYNGKKIKLVIANDCGSNEYEQTITINTLPVPEMLKDTTVCADPANNFTLSVANVHTGSTYVWFDSEGTSVASGASTILPAGVVDTVMTFFVVETDVNNCVSKTQINVSSDTISSDVITVKVTSKPYFVFTNLSGVETHDINSSINNETTGYRWTLGNCDYPDDTKVFVTFDIYHNDTLIPASQISNYISTATTTVDLTSHTWNTNQYVEYPTSGPVLNAYAFYTSMQNHYPYFNLSGSNYYYDWLYLHFLTSRTVTNTVAKFIQDGDYEIHYALYATDGSELNNYYNAGGVSKKIGGQDFHGATLLASDVFTIHVNSSSAVAENEAPEAPSVEPIASEPTVKLYPNPTSENVNVRIEGISGQTTIRISTLTGKTVAHRAISIDNDFSIETFNVSDLTPGVYVLQIVNDDAVISRKLVITK